MKSAIGIAITASITVTPSATRMVRRATVPKSGSVTSRARLSSVNVCSTAPVKSLTVQNAETSITAIDPRYITTSQSSGTLRSSASRALGLVER